MPIKNNLMFTISIVLCLVMGCGVGVENRTKGTLLETLPSATLPQAITARSDEQLGLETVYLENTNLVVNPAPGNIAWSTSGTQLAYTYGFSLWVVPDNQWEKSTKIYTLTHPYLLEDRFLAWSPDDLLLGFTLLEPINNMQADSKIAQLDWQNKTLSIISEEVTATFIDWSKTGLILAQRDDGIWVFDTVTSNWQAIKDPFDGETAQGFPHWSLDSQSKLILGLPDDKGFVLMDWHTAEWNILNDIQSVGNTAFPIMPVLSPNSRWIAWIETVLIADDYVWKIMLYDREDAEIVELANSRSYESTQWQALTWSPNSESLAFSARHEKEHTIWLLHFNSH